MPFYLSCACLPCLSPRISQWCTRTQGRGKPRTRDMVDSLRHVCSASGRASTPVHGRRALHLEGDWCTIDSSPGAKRHPQVAYCELRCHGVIPRTRHSTWSSALTVSLCEAVLLCPRPEGRACRRHRHGRHNKDPNVLAVPTNMSEVMTGINMDELATRWAERTRSQKCHVASVEEVRRKSHSDGLFACHWLTRGDFRPSRRQQAISSLNLDTEASLDPSGITNSGITRGKKPSCAALFAQDLFGTSQ